MFNWKMSTLTSSRLQISELRKKIKDMFSNRNETLNEILFYGAEDEEQRKKVGLNNLLCIYYVLIHASDSIDLCAPSLSSDTIVKSLISVKQKASMKIRIAIYHSVDYEILKTVAKYGIEVKVISSAIQLQHEFILIDASHADAVAIIGSVDYEVTRVNCNRDSTVITSEPTVVSTMRREFERIWKSTPEVKQ